MRIISLLPAATEIVYALGMGDELVGRSHECDFPEAAQSLPVCSDAKFTSGANSKEIDEQVKNILSNALSIYTIDKERIRDLKPDVIITQAQCEVCAVSLADVEEALADYIGDEVKIISLQPQNLADIFKEIKLIGDALNVPKKADELLYDLQERVDLVEHKHKFFAEKPTVVNIEWLNPLMVSGNWIPEVVEKAGGKSLLAPAGKHSPFLSWDEIKAADPDVLVVMPCGFSISRSLQEIDLLLNLDGWTSLKAVKNNRIYITDGNNYFNRSGPRIVDSIEIMAEIISPKYFAYGYEGKGWIKFEQ